MLCEYLSSFCIHKLIKYLYFIIIFQTNSERVENTTYKILCMIFRSFTAWGGRHFGGRGLGKGGEGKHKKENITEKLNKNGKVFLQTQRKGCNLFSFVFFSCFITLCFANNECKTKRVDINFWFIIYTRFVPLMKWFNSSGYWLEII